MTISTAVPASAVARVLGIETRYQNRRNGNAVFLPQRLALVGQGASAATYPTTKAQYTSALAVAETYGFGSPLHLAALQLLPVNGDGINSIPLTVYPLEDAGTSVAAVGDVTPSGAQTEAAAYQISINNIRSQSFVVSIGDTVADIVAKMVAAVNAVLEMPVLATDGATAMTLTAKWAGVSGNDLFTEVIGSTSAGTVYAITQPTGGLVNPTVDAALAQVGDVWETMFLNCLDITDTVALGAYATFGEGRWGALTHKPCIVFSGQTALTVNDAIAIPEARKTDRTNAQLAAPGSNDLPFVVAARQLARIIVRADSNPAFDYGSLDADGLTPGTDGDQWDYLARDQAVKGGSSTIEVKDGVINLSDIITFYHPDGDPLPPYRYVVDIVKLQNVIFNVALEFNTDQWDGAPLLPDNQPTVNRSAKKPRMAVAAAAAILDGLGLQAILSDVETSKAGIAAEIDAANPKRLNIRIPVNVSGNSNIKSIDIDWGFFFGTPTVVA